MYPSTSDESDEDNDIENSGIKSEEVDGMNLQNTADDPEEFLGWQKDDPKFDNQRRTNTDNKNDDMNDQNEYDAWKKVHQMLLEAVQVSEETVTVLKLQKRYWLEEICSNITSDGKLYANSTWRLNRSSGTGNTASTAVLNNSNAASSGIVTKKMKKVGPAKTMVEKVGKGLVASDGFDSSSKKRKAAVDEDKLRAKKSKMVKKTDSSTLKVKKKEHGKSVVQKEKGKELKQDKQRGHQDDIEDDGDQNSSKFDFTTNKKGKDKNVADSDSDDERVDRSFIGTKKVTSKDSKIKLKPKLKIKINDKLPPSSTKKRASVTAPGNKRPVKSLPKSKKGKVSSYDDIDDENDSQDLQQPVTSFASDDVENNDSDDDGYSSLHTPNRSNDRKVSALAASLSNPTDYSILANAALQQLQQQQQHIPLSTTTASSATSLLGHHNTAAATAALLSSTSASTNPEVWLSALAAVQQQQQQQQAVAAAAQNLPPNILAALISGGCSAQSVAAVAAQLQLQQHAANMIPQLSPQFSSGVGGVASPYTALQQQLFQKQQLQQQQQQQQQQYQQQLLSSVVGGGYGTTYEQQLQQNMMPSNGPRTYSSLQDIGSDEDDSDQDRF